MTTVNITQENIEKEVTNSEIPVILDFWANWCMPCQMMGPVFEELSNEYKGKLKFGKVNTEKEIEIASFFQIRGIPTLTMINNKKAVWQTSGFMTKDVLKKNIDEALKKLK